MSELILKETVVEEKIVKELKNIGYLYKDKPQFNEKINNFKEVVDFNLLQEQMLKINKLDERYIFEAIKKIKNQNFSFVSEGNRVFLDFLKNGVKVKIKDLNESRTINVQLIDFENLENNIFYFYNQFSYLTNQNERKIPDIVIFLNGLPIVVFELKAPEAKEKLIDAYYQLKNYQNTKKELMYWNLFCIVSNGFITKYGTLFSEFNSHWWSWKKIDKDSEIKNDFDSNINFNLNVNDNVALNNCEITIKGLLKKETILNIIKNYCFWSNDTNKNIKYIPTYYQYYAVEKTIDAIKKCTNKKVGMIWHTQGSGKSVTMVFLAHMINEKIREKKYKIIFITDRNDLDDQLHKRLVDARDYLLTDALNISSRKELIEKLSDDKQFGIYTTTIQKFSEDSKMLSDKDNVIIIADEAHRSHNNLDVEYEIDTENKKILEKEGYARYLRKSFPNAIFIGFTGTPLMGDKKTIDIFGDEIDRYSMEQSVRDNATVPIHYEKRRLEIILNDIKLNELNEISKESFNEDDSESVKEMKKEYLRKKITKISNILNNPKFIKEIVHDFWNHYEKRKNVLNGKAMFVAFNRENAINIYKEMISQKPEYEKNIGIIITKNNKDSEEFLKYIYNEEKKREYAIKFKKDDSEIKIVVVVDMWLTGFDVPDLDTMYILKIMRFHNLMQALARVNRTYENNKSNKTKNHGLIVDYLGIWKYIAEALKIYGGMSDVQLYDIEDSKIKIKWLLNDIISKHFHNENLINEWVENKQNFESLSKGLNIIVEFGKKEKDTFFKKIDKLKKLFNICKQILETNDFFKCQYFLLVTSLFKNEKIEENVDIENTLIKLKEKMKDIVDTGEIEISKILLDGKKDLTYVMNLLKSEYDSYKKDKKINKISILNIQNNLESQVNEFIKKNPIKGREISDELKKMIEKFEEDKNYEELLTKLIEFAKEMIKDNEKEKWIGDDEKLLIFFNVLSSEKFKIQNYNSEILREIVFNMKNIIEKKMTSEWENNDKLKSEIKNDILALLLTKYNYPPKEATEISKIIIDETNKIIHRNKDAFNEK